MVKTIIQYLRDEVCLRLRTIVLDSSGWIAVTFSTLIIYYGGERLFTENVILNMANYLLTYASIALGFSLTGLTLVIALPDKMFARTLALKAIKGRPGNAYTNLLFVFSWTACCHWLLIVTTILMLIFSFCSSQLHEGASIISAVMIWVVLANTVYCVEQFLITIITLSQVGNLYAKVIIKDTNKDE